MSNEIQQNRYDQLIRRVTGSIGPGSKVAETITELFPMIDVENLPPELLVYAGWNAAFRSTAIGGVAGNENASQLFNPAGSGKIIVLTKVYVRSSVISVVNFTTSTTPLTSSNGFGVLRDFRATSGVPAAAVGNTRVQTGISIAAGGTLFIRSDRTMELEDVNGLAILIPGTGWSIGTITQNTALTVSYFWRERVAEQSELNF